MPTPSMVAGFISGHTVTGTLAVRDDHYSSVTVPFEELAAIPAHPSGTVPDFGKLALVVDIDDAAPAITAPSNLSSFRLEQLFGPLG